MWNGYPSGHGIAGLKTGPNRQILTLMTSYLICYTSINVGQESCRKCQNICCTMLDSSSAEFRPPRPTPSLHTFGAPLNDQRFIKASCTKMYLYTMYNTEHKNSKY